MRLVPMRFKGFEWHHNPGEISFECDKQVNELKTPDGAAYIQNMGRNNMKICGSGELYGEDCLVQFEKLIDLFKQGGSGVLAIPHIEPVCAVFENIKILGQPRPDILSYSFVFREVMEYKKTDIPRTHKVVDDENLWDISYKYGISIDELVRLNTWIKRPDMLSEGVEVTLC